nr:hypothetical protein [Tanacetum cinerariifolium]
MGNVKKFVAERTRRQRQYDRRVNKRQMQTQESKIDTGKVVDADLVVTKSSKTESEVQDDSSRPGNDTDADDADIRPIDDEEPMAEVQLTAECNTFAIGKQHSEQPKIINEGRVDQYPEQCQVKSLMLDSSPDNQTTDNSKQSFESENILLKKTVAQFQKDFSRMEEHYIALELKYQNQALKSRQHGQILNETSNKAKIKKQINVLKTMNIELEHNVAKLQQTTSLLANNADLKAQIQEKVFAIAALKNDLRKLIGNNVDTKFAKTSVLGKLVLQSLRNQSVFRQPNAFKSERPQISKQREEKRRESVFTKPDHMIASSDSRNSSKNIPRFSSNGIVHNHYLDEARKKTHERDRNSKTSGMSYARFQSTADGNKPKPRSTNHSTRICPSDLRWKPTGRFFKTFGLGWVPTRKILASYTIKDDSEPTHGSNVDILNIHESKQTLDVSACTSINVQKEQSLDLSTGMDTLSLVSKYLNDLEEYLDDVDSLEARKLMVRKSKDELELFEELEHKNVVIKEGKHRVVMFAKAPPRTYSKPFTRFSLPCDMDGQGVWDVELDMADSFNYMMMERFDKLGFVRVDYGKYERMMVKEVCVEIHGFTFLVDFVMIGCINEGEPSVIFCKDFLVTSKSKVDFGIGVMRINLTILEEEKDLDAKLEDNIQAKAIGEVRNVRIQIRYQAYLVDFLVLDIPVDKELPLLLGRLFLRTCGAVIDMGRGRDEDGNPKYGPLLTSFLDTKDDMERALAIEAYFNPKIEGDGACHAKFEVITLSGRKFTRGFKTKETKRKLYGKFTSKDILKFNHFLGAFKLGLVCSFMLVYAYICYFCKKLSKVHTRNLLIANFEKQNKQVTIEYHVKQEKNDNLKWRELTSMMRHAYCERLSKLQGKEIRTPRVADWTVFYSYNFNETLKNKMKFEYLYSDGDVFEDYSWERALSISGDVYPKWCLEFFSTMYSDKGVNRTKLMTEKCIWFRLCGHKQVLILPYFTILLGLYEESELEHRLFSIHFTKLEMDDKLFNHDAYSHKIGTPTRTNPRTSLIKEPLMRIVHRLIIGSLVHSACSKERCQKRDLWLMSALEESRGINLAWVIAEHLCKHASGLKENSLICGAHYVTKIAQSLGYIMDEEVEKCSKPIECEKWTTKTLASELDEDVHSLFLNKSERKDVWRDSLYMRNNYMLKHSMPILHHLADQSIFAYPTYVPQNVLPYPYPYVPYPHLYTHYPDTGNQSYGDEHYGTHNDAYYIRPIIPSSSCEIGGSSGGVHEDDMSDQYMRSENYEASEDDDMQD